jgi:hypothetical protein
MTPAEHRAAADALLEELARPEPVIIMAVTPEGKLALAEVVRRGLGVWTGARFRRLIALASRAA